MRIPTSRSDQFQNQSMTPMIDVVFLLLVFFVCASVGRKPDLLLPAELSEGQSERSTEPVVNDPLDFESQTATIKLSINAESQLDIFLNGQPLTGGKQLKQRLTLLVDIDSATKIIVDPTDDVRVQQFVAVYDLCQSLKFESISFAVRKTSE